MVRQTRKSMRAKKKEDVEEDSKAESGTRKRVGTRRASFKQEKIAAKKVINDDEDKDEEDATDANGDSGYEQKETESTSEVAEAELDSDAIDDSDFDASRSAARKRKRVSTASKASPVRKESSRKRAKKGEEGDYSDGLEVVGEIVHAPKTGRVPPGQISKNTFNFLKQLEDPECNDRTWFKLHEPVYRQAEKEWKDFIEELTPLIVEADPQLPVLPPRDVVYRIYRDVRFSNDKTPYKTNFSASFSRSGRKGIFAGFQPGGSLMAAGSWCPNKPELECIRTSIKRNAQRLRNLISEPKFVKLFGEPIPHPEGKRRSIFGREDELKVAPKGIFKEHKQIDLLRCRSFVVVHRFSDEQALSPNFRHELKRILEVARPFVHGLNDMMSIPDSDGDEDEEDTRSDAAVNGESEPRH